jgi:hypothetical protein
MEDLPPLGINFVKLGLNDVLLDPETGMIYTPNTNQYATMGESAEIPLTDEGNSGKIEREIRAKGGNPNHNSKNGRFTFKFEHTIKLDPKEYEQVKSEIATWDPQPEIGDAGIFETTTTLYAFEKLNTGTYRFMYRIKTQTKTGKKYNTNKAKIIKEGVEEWNLTRHAKE